MRVRLTVTGRAGYSMGSVNGRWTGKPVRIRRGPATVTGEAHRTRPRPQPLVSQREPGRRRRVEPGSQETSLRPKPISPRGKGWLQPMKMRTPAGLGAGIVSAALLAAPAAAAPVTVDLRIEGPSRTLFEGRSEERRVGKEGRARWWPE